MLTATKGGTFSTSSDPYVFFPLAAAGVYPKTRVRGSSQKMLHCFSATAPLSGNARRGWESSSGETTAGSALDNNGNTTSKTDSTGTTQYAWDFGNRLSSVTLPGSGGNVSFKYDPFGKRIFKSSSAGTSIYVYDGPNLIEEVNSSGAVVARYSQTLNIDDTLAMLRGGATSYYHADALGSMTSLSNAGGVLAQTYTYDSFGKLTASAGTLVNPFRYTAREFDSETGLYFYRARQYDAGNGRFLSEDLRRFGSDTNFYAYVFNSSVNYVDPYGLSACKSGKCADCPGGRWVGAALSADASLKVYFYNRGGIAFGGALVCTSNPKLIVPFYTICSFRSVSYTKEPLTGPPARGIGPDIGAGGAGLTCGGMHCREDLAGPEDGVFGQLGPYWGFREGTKGGGKCSGGGFDAGAEITIGGGGFSCNTTIPNK
jgi:RHS repeat-associated protein